MTQSRLARFAVHGGALSLVALVVYLALAPTHVVDGDNAELSAVGAIGGRAHPPGYPAYVLYLRLMSWLPGASAAHTAALATALLSVVLVLVLHAACRAWGARPAAATFAVAIYAASPVVLRMHTEAEVFGPNALIVALVLWLAATRGPVQGVWRAALLGLVAGVGLGNHTTCVLVAPIGLLGAVRAIRETQSSKIFPVVAAIGGLALGLTTYAYLAIADGPISFGAITSFGDVLDFFLRTDYGGPGAFVPTGTDPMPAASLAALAATLLRGWLWLPGLLGLGVLGWRAVRVADDGEPRIGWALLAVSWLVAGPLLVFRFNIEPVGLGLYVVQRFHLLPLLLLTLPVAVGFDLVGSWLVRRIGSERLRGQGVATAAAVLLFVALVATSLSWLRGAHSPAMEYGVRNMLASLPPNAVVVINAEDLCFGSDYVQYATGQRADVEVACWAVTSRAWYRDRLAKHGVPVVGDYSDELTPAQADAILATGRLLFTDRSHAALLAERPSYPHGILNRVLAKGEALPPLHEILELNRNLYAAFALDYPRPRWGDDWAAVAHRRYAITWAKLGDALERAGDPAGAADARELSRQLAPERE